MSKRTDKAELPHDANVVQALRRELHRNTRQISQAFWQEFEQIRAQQRNQLAQERDDRVRISTMMQEANREAQQRAEALISTMSAHGINPSAPSPIMRKEREPEMEQMAQQVQQAQKMKRMQQKTPQRHTLFSNVKKRNRSPIARMLAEQLAAARPISNTTHTPAPSSLPRAPPTSLATMVSNSTRNTSTMSKLQLARKPMK